MIRNVLHSSDLELKNFDCQLTALNCIFRIKRIVLECAREGKLPLYLI